MNHSLFQLFHVFMLLCTLLSYLQDEKAELDSVRSCHLKFPSIIWFFFFTDFIPIKESFLRGGYQGFSPVLRHGGFWI